MKLKKHLWGFLASLVVVIVIALLSSAIQTGGWRCSIEDLRSVTNTGTKEILANDKTEAAKYTVKGEVSSGLLITPKIAKKAPVPGVVLTHGLYNNREMQLQNGIELARRGFVVLMIDRQAHGLSSQLTSYPNYGDPMLQAAKYLYNLTDAKGNHLVDQSKIAISGHSMGGSATNSGLALDGVDTKGSIKTVSGSTTTTNTWVGNTDAALKAGYHMGIISAGLVQANNASNSSYGSNLLGVGIVKASSDEFFFSSSLKNPTYVPIAPNKTSMTEVMFNQGVAGTYTGSTDGKIYVKDGKEFRAVTEKDSFHQKKQYYKFTKTGNSVFYLQSSQAAAFTRKTFTTAEEDWTTVNGGVYDFAAGTLIGGEYGKLLSKVNKGTQVASATKQIRVVYEAKETHPMNHCSVVSARHVIDFMYNVFGTPTGAKFKAPANQTWWLKEAIAIIGIAGMFAMVICLAGLLLDTKAFESLKAKEGEVEAETLPLLKSPRRHVSYWLSGVLTALFGAYSLWNNAKWYGKSLLKQYIVDATSDLTGITYTIWANIGDIAYWGIICALFGLMVALVIHFVNILIDMFKYGDAWKEQPRVSPLKPLKIRSLGNVFKTLALVVVLVAAFEGVIAILWRVLVVDFRIWTFDLKIFKLSNLMSYLRYVPFFGVFYVLNAALNEGFKAKDLPEWATIAINVCFNVIGLIMLLGICNAHFINVGAMPHSANSLFFIAAYPIIPCVMCATVVSRLMYKETGNAWVAGLFNAIVFTILACANTSIAGIS